MADRTLKWNEAAMWVGAISALRLTTDGKVERAMTACMVHAKDKEQAKELAMQEALSAFPTDEGWGSYQAATVCYTVEVRGGPMAFALPPSPPTP